MALGTEFIISYLSDITKAVKGAKDLEQVNTNTAKNIIKEYGEVKRVVGEIQPKSTFSTIPSGRFAGLQKEMREMGTIAEMTSGKFVQFGQKQTIVGGQLVSTSGAIKDVTNQFARTAIGAEKASIKTKDFLTQIKELGLRALLVVPIWEAMRAGLNSLKAVFGDGFNDLVQESLLLDKVKKSLQGTTSEIAASMSIIKNETQSLALETGVSHNKIINSFQRFVATGLDVATAMSATNAVIKLGVITNSDASQSAESLAHAFSVLINTNASAVDKQKQINDVISLTSELWKTNGFNIEEFTGSLEKFAITSKSVNFTTNQTLALLATLSKSGLGSAGNLLRNSMGQLLVNMDKLAGSLGVKVNPALDDTFSVLMKVLAQLDKLQKVNDLKGLETAKEALKDIFGGTRSAVPIVALSSLYEALKKNLGLTSDINKFNASFKETEGVLGNVVARIHTTNAEIGKSFVQGILGADSFEGGLEKVAATLKQIELNAQNFGEAARNAFVNPLGSTLEQFLKLDKVSADIAAQLNAQITKGLKFDLPLPDLKKTIAGVTEAMKGNIDLGLSPEALGMIYSNLSKQLVGTEEANKRVALLQAEINSQVSETTVLEKKSADIQLKKVDFVKLEGFAKKELAALGLSEIEIESRILALRDASNLYSEKDIFLQKELITHLQAVEEIELKRTRATGLIDNQLELLKLQGATSVQLVQQRIELEKTFGINQTRAAMLKNELELNKEITKEKINQNKFSSDSLKIFQISQKYGLQKANQAAEFLRGNVSLNELQPTGRSSDLMPIIKEFFASQLEQMQASEFFTKGQGINLPIPEKAAMQNVTPIDLNSIKLPDINTNVGNINVEVKKLFKEEDTAKQIMDSMLDAIRNNPAIEDAINEKIDSF